MPKAKTRAADIAMRNTVTGVKNKSLCAALGNIECMIARLKAGATLV
jgi:hypothetical protein